MRPVLLPILESLDNRGEQEKMTYFENIRFMMFIGLLGLVYIANTHYAERNLREIGAVQQELKELRWEVMTTKSELMFKCRQSVIMQDVKSLGLQMSGPPRTIIVGEEEDGAS